MEANKCCARCLSWTHKRDSADCKAPRSSCTHEDNGNCCKSDHAKMVHGSNQAYCDTLQITQDTIALSNTFSEAIVLDANVNQDITKLMNGATTASVISQRGNSWNKLRGCVQKLGGRSTHQQPPRSSRTALSEVKTMMGERCSNGSYKGTVSQILATGGLKVKVMIPSFKTDKNAMDTLGHRVLGYQWNAREDSMAVSLPINTSGSGK